MNTFFYTRPNFLQITLWISSFFVINNGNVQLNINQSNIAPVPLIIFPVEFNKPVEILPITHTTESAPPSIKKTVTDKKIVRKKDTNAINRSNSLYGYTPYQIMAWHLKAHESFRPTKYPDGKYPSIGFGLNLHPRNRQFAARELADGRFTWNEGISVTQRYIETFLYPDIKTNYPNATPIQLVALAVHKYNTGNIRTFGFCCGSRSTKMRCGKGNKNIRKSHHARRVYEVRLYNGTITHKEINHDREKAIELDKRWKNH